jgi:aromatic ring hydroxylase
VQVAALKGALSQLADSGDAAALLANATAGATKSSRATAAATVAAAVASKELNLARGKEFSQRVQQLSTLLQTRDKELADAEVSVFIYMSRIRIHYVYTYALG